MFCSQEKGCSWGWIPYQRLPSLTALRKQVKFPWNARFWGTGYQMMMKHEVIQVRIGLEGAVHLCQSIWDVDILIEHPLISGNRPSHFRVGSPTSARRISGKSALRQTNSHLIDWRAGQFYTIQFSGKCLTKSSYKRLGEARLSS